MRARRIVGGAVVALAVAGAGTLAWDRLAATDVDFGGSDRNGEVELHCWQRPISDGEWWVEDESGEARWRADLPSSGALESADAEHAFFPTLGVWETRRRAWAVVVLDAVPRRCSDWPEEMPEWLDAESSSVRHRDDEEGDAERHGKSPGQYGIETEEPSDAHLAREATDRHRHAESIEPGSVEPRPRRYCLIEAAAGLRWCVETEAAPLDRTVIPGVAIVELVDLAPRALLGRSLESGELLWRTEVPEDAAAVWLVRAADGGLGLRANEDYFSLDPASGALARITPDGGEVCAVAPLVIAVGGGVVGATLEHPPRFVELGRTPPGATLGSCSGGGAALGTIALGPIDGPHAVRIPPTSVVVSAPAAEGATLAEPVPIDASSAAPAGGAALYLVASDATLVGAWSVPWARTVGMDESGTYAVTAAGTVALRHDATGLHLSAPDAGMP